MQTITVLGLGRMGLPIAQRLATVAAVTGVDIDPRRRDDAREAGLVVSERGVDAVGSADVVVSVLTGARVERDALLGAEGLLSAMARGAMLLELASGDPALALELARAAAARDVAYVAAPMAGGPGDAAAGTLGFFLGGADAALARAEALLRHLGARFQRVGAEPAHAQTAKLLVNALWFGQAALVGEAMVLGARAGIAPATLQRVLSASAAGSVFVDEHLPRALAGDDMAEFGVAEIVEELQAAASLADRLGTPAAMIGETARVHERALARFGPIDAELVAVRLAEAHAGVRLTEH